MTLMGHFPLAVAAAMPIPHAAEMGSIIALPQPEIAAPFSPTRNIVLYSGDLHNVFWRDQYFEASIAGAHKLSVKVQAVDKSTAGLVQEFKRVSGLTWAQLASTFEVSSRAAFDWASGKPVNAKNHEKLGLAVAAIRFIDRGSAEENRNLLLSEAQVGQTYLDMFRLGELEQAQELAGKGAGRPTFGQTLTAEATKYNAPRHFGQSVELSIASDDSEILPVQEPKLRRVKARRSKA
ncbi:hypothetical protein [Sulfitobacter pacificus]|uniref:Transcriptional regulator n=1 Tax=Sulfitobacter pacificus TaxID=1499314 RepID=A0ABQ5VM10_9RHOB|nr:hypothetical protein [Sulfitobacter pacificus]GLQ28069.1 hypothetical protein GCM10007927_28720 [Sulfitobacter pacificus]